MEQQQISSTSLQPIKIKLDLVSASQQNNTVHDRKTTVAKQHITTQHISAWEWHDAGKC